MTKNIPPTALNTTSASYSDTLLFWHRRDLRIEDNFGLYQANTKAQVQSVFIFDSTILNALPSYDRRVDFIYQSVKELADAYVQHGSSLWILHGDPKILIPQLCSHHGFKAVATNKDYELTARQRDTYIAQKLHAQSVKFFAFKDHVIFEDTQIRTQTGSPFMVFTPFKNRWLELYQSNPPSSLPVPSRLRPTTIETSLYPLMPLEELGFYHTDLSHLGVLTGATGASKTLEKFIQQNIYAYAHQRDYPQAFGTSRIGVHLRFGTIGIRDVVGRAYECMKQHPQNPDVMTWISELIWRDFYSALLSRNPNQSTGQCFNSVYNDFSWRSDPEMFYAWSHALTGYPIVDAGITELIQTGYMHNRVRMIVASFLCKHLLIHWHQGATFFSRHLLDYDEASNIGGWQWSASTGCDAQPYFRIFNPTSQSERFDPQGVYIKKWLPHLDLVPTKYIHSPWEMNMNEQQQSSVILGVHYPHPIIEHQAARQRALRAFEAHTTKK